MSERILVEKEVVGPSGKVRVAKYYKVGNTDQESAPEVTVSTVDNGGENVKA